MTDEKALRLVWERQGLFFADFCGGAFPYFILRPFAILMPREVARAGRPLRSSMPPWSVVWSLMYQSPP